MKDEDGNEIDDNGNIIEPEKKPEFANIDEAVNFFKTEMEAFKKLAKPDGKNRQSKDEFKLYHEQMETRLNDMNTKLTSFDEVVKNVVAKLTHKGTSYSFNQAWDFLFKM